MENKEQSEIILYADLVFKEKKNLIIYSLLVLKTENVVLCNIFVETISFQDFLINRKF